MSAGLMEGCKGIDRHAAENWNRGSVVCVRACVCVMNPEPSPPFEK